jgi:hypothetical protein
VTSTYRPYHAPAPRPALPVPNWDVSTYRPPPSVRGKSLKITAPRDDSSSVEIDDPEPDECEALGGRS